METYWLSVGFRVWGHRVLGLRAHSCAETLRAYAQVAPALVALPRNAAQLPAKYPPLYIRARGRGGGNLTTGDRD